MTSPTKQERYLRAWLKDAGLETVLDALIAQIPAEAHTPVPWEAPLDLKRWRACYKALTRARSEIRCYRPPEKDLKADIADYVREYPEDAKYVPHVHFSEESVMGTSVQSSDFLRRFDDWRSCGRKTRQEREALEAASEQTRRFGHCLYHASGVPWVGELRPHHIARVLEAATDAGCEPAFTRWLISERPDLEPVILGARQERNAAWTMNPSTTSCGA